MAERPASPLPGSGSGSDSGSGSGLGLGLAAGLTLAPAHAGFGDWPGLLALLHQAFAFQTGRIDPPSSLHRMDARALAAKAAAEHLVLAHADGALVGCVFGRPEGDAVYIGKLAVADAWQGRGLGRALVAAVASWARAQGAQALVLDVRIELVENHRAFGAMGFVKTGEHAHPGHARPTFITMRKALA